MPIVQLPDGSTAQFPDGMAPDAIGSAVSQFWSQKSQPTADMAGSVSAPIPPANPPDKASVTPTPGLFNDQYQPTFPLASESALEAYIPQANPSVSQGVGDPALGGAQLFLRGIEAAAPQDSEVGKKAKALRQALDQHIADREAEYQKQHPDKAGSFDAGRMIGNIIGAAPLAAIGPEGLAGAATTGAAIGTLQPSTAQGSDYWLEKAKEAAVGAAGGAAGKVIGGAAARVLSPNTSEDVTKLVESGVNPTPGQMLGKGLSRVEEGATSIPLTGDVVKAGQRGALEDFNRATLNQVLGPIGQQIDENTPIGRKAIDEAARKVGDAYDQLVPSLTAKVDAPFVNAVQQTAQLAKNLPGDYADQFASVLKNEVLSKFSPNGTMTGQTFKEVESTLGQMASDYSHSASVNERYFGSAVRELQDQMRQLLARSNPDAAQALQANNAAYAMLKRVQTASAASVKGGGVFTPSQLLQAIRSQDPSLGKGSFARGNALMQIYGEAGENVLGSKLPDSGTAFRSMVDHPIQSAVLSPTALIALAPYSALGRKIATTLLARRPDLARQLAPGLRNIAPLVGAVGATEQGSQPAAQ